MTNLIHLKTARDINLEVEAEAIIDAPKEHERIAKCLLSFLPYKEQNNPNELCDLVTLLFHLNALKDKFPDFSLTEIGYIILDDRDDVYEAARQKGLID